MLGFSTMGITFIMGGYIMLGAVIFSGLEGGCIILIMTALVCLTDLPRPLRNASSFHPSRRIAS